MKANIAALITEALLEAREEGELAFDELLDPAVERPRDMSHGDWATSIALRSAKLFCKSPADIAKIIAAHIPLDGVVQEVSIAGPGFINFKLSHEALTSVLKDIRSSDAKFGSNERGEGIVQQVEFVSANPVGPMHIGHGRWAALGDSISNILSHSGYSVQREFYVNDAGAQMDKFAKSIYVRALELKGESAEFPEDGYKGEYIIDIARAVIADQGEALFELEEEEALIVCREFGYASVMENIKSVLESFGVHFDVFFSERSLYINDEAGENEVTRAIARLRKNGYIYDLDGAVWFESTRFDDDKDRVLIKENGEYTYFAADIAYHNNKYERGIMQIINILGADHHGYVERMNAAVAALGYPGTFNALIGQLVNILEDGKPARLSKRAGKIVTFDALVEEVGKDAARYGLLRHSTDQRLDFDIAKAKEQSSDNPVYYVQYAHARICSIMRRAFPELEGASADEIAEQIPADVSLDSLDSEAERALLTKLASFGEQVEIAARELAPHKITNYCEELAASFHHFYAHCTVLDENAEVRAARLFAIDGVRRTLRVAFSLLGISAPERM